MTITNKNEAFLLFLGDLFVFFLSLWLMLLLRFGGIPEGGVFLDHISSFSIIFILWFFVFFIAGLYEKHTLILKSKIPTIIFNAQLFNSVVAVFFFYFVPVFGIAPKTNLFIFVIISFLLILYWRNQGIAIFFSRPREQAVLIGSGDEVRELTTEVNNNTRYGLYFAETVDSSVLKNPAEREKLAQKITSQKIQIVSADFKDPEIEPFMSQLYELIFSSVRFVDMYRVYEDIFDRVPMSLIRHSWFLENISVSSRNVYDVVKRMMDIVASISLGMVSFVVYPFVWLAITLEDRGPIFITQDRVGQHNRIIKVTKFRSMTTNDQGEYDGATAQKNRVTKVGAFLRKTRIDELPQLWNVLRGDLSLIGPRPELPALAAVYEKEIPYYNVRHLIKPGLSGWAQLYQRVPPKGAVATNETKSKLSYDLYYLKNRSMMLDFKIALKTIKTLVSRNGI